MSAAAATERTEGRTGQTERERAVTGGKGDAGDQRSSEIELIPILFAVLLLLLLPRQRLVSAGSRCRHRQREKREREEERASVIREAEGEESLGDQRRCNIWLGKQSAAASMSLCVARQGK